MRHVAGKYEIDVSKEHFLRYTEIDSAWKYNLIYLGDPYEDHYNLIGIKIYQEEEIVNSAIIGSYGPGGVIKESSCIFEEERLLICCSDEIFCLSIPNLKLYWKKKCDTVECFKIFKFGDDYLIHGELEITRLSDDGKIKWQQSLADIITSVTIEIDNIVATDWENRKYKFDFEGNLI